MSTENALKKLQVIQTKSSSINFLFSFSQWLKQTWKIQALILQVCMSKLCGREILLYVSELFTSIILPHALIFAGQVCVTVRIFYMKRE